MDNGWSCKYKDTWNNNELWVCYESENEMKDVASMDITGRASGLRNNSHVLMCYRRYEMDCVGRQVYVVGTKGLCALVSVLLATIAKRYYRGFWVLI